LGQRYAIVEARRDIRWVRAPEKKGKVLGDTTELPETVAPACNGNVGFEVSGIETPASLTDIDVMEASPSFLIESA
jgi:hypothetical protein